MTFATRPFTYVALANSWIIIIINVGGGPTDDKQTVTLEPRVAQQIILGATYEEAETRCCQSSHRRRTHAARLPKARNPLADGVARLLTV